MKKIIEIRPAEGGADSRNLIKIFLQYYIKKIENKKYTYHISRDDMYGIDIILNTDDDKFLNDENGGHRVQRVPPTEKNGRVHTSSITVAVLDYIEKNDIDISEKDFYIEWFSGTGSGGQHRNKNQCCCRIIHKDSGIIKTGTNSRSRKNNFEEAYKSLKEQLNISHKEKSINDMSSIRKYKKGCGSRGNKIRTYRFTDNIVIDHRINKKYNLQKFMKCEY